MKGVKFQEVKIVPAKGVTGLPKQGTLVVEDEIGIIIKAEVKGTRKNPGGEALVRIPSSSYRCFMSVPEAEETTTPKKRGRKAKTEAEEITTPKKRGRKAGRKATKKVAPKLTKKGKKARKAKTEAEETPTKKGKKGKKHLRVKAGKKGKLTKKGKKGKKDRAKIANLLQGARKL